jgi:hypothetical protein
MWEIENHSTPSPFANSLAFLQVPCIYLKLDLDSRLPELRDVGLAIRVL